MTLSIEDQLEMMRDVTWHHIKSGGHYRIKDIALMEADLKPYVVYERVSGEDGVRWLRPITEFLDGRFRAVGVDGSDE